MQHRVVRAQNVSRMCVVCGRENSSSLRGRFFELDNGELLGIFEPTEEHQGYPGRLHGGVSSAMLDETIGRAINITQPDAWGVTVELSVKFKAPVPTEGPLRVVGRVTSDSNRVFEGTGELVLADGTVAVEATGKYVKLPIERIAEGDFTREWLPDEGETPESIEL